MASETQFKPGNPGRPKGSKNESTKIASLFAKDQIEDCVKELFLQRDKFVVPFVLEHYYGKPENVNKNLNKNEFPAGLEITFTRPKTESEKQENPQPQS